MGDRGADVSDGVLEFSGRGEVLLQEVVKGRRGDGLSSVSVHLLQLLGIFDGDEALPSRVSLLLEDADFFCNGSVTFRKTSYMNSVSYLKTIGYIFTRNSINYYK